MDEFIKKSVVVTEEQMKEKEKNNEWLCLNLLALLNSLLIEKVVHSITT